MAGFPQASNSVTSSRDTRTPDSEMSAIRARHSRVQSSTTVMIRNRRPAQLVGYEVRRPALVWYQRQHRWGSHADGPFAPAPATHMQPLLPADPGQAFMVHLMAFAPQEHMQPTIAEPAAHPRQFPQVRHGSATITFAVRAAIQRSQTSLAQLSRDLGIDSGTVAKWRKRARPRISRRGRRSCAPWC